MRRAAVIVPVILYLALLAGFWEAARHSALRPLLGTGFALVFAAFSLILAPLLAFGFGAGEWLRTYLRSPASRIAVAGLAVVPYVISAAGTGSFAWQMGAAFLLLPIALAIALELSPSSPALIPADVLVLVFLAVPFVLHWFAAAWPQPGLSGLPKLLLTDVVLYLYLVIRRLPRIGYDLRPRPADLAIGAREWLLFAPIAIVLGLALGFLNIHALVPPAARTIGALVFTFFFIALPEEFFFRGVLLNLLEGRMRPWAALLVSAVLFGLAHFNKGAVFNWRYVVLASLAGWFYGRAWQRQNRILAAVITHTLVDVTWSIWRY